MMIFHLVKRLLSEGNEVIGFDNLSNYYYVSLKESRLRELSGFKDFTFIKGDLVDVRKVNSLFEELCPEVVVNLATQAGVRYSIQNPRACIDSNVVGFINTLEACPHNLVKHHIYSSSSSLYGNQVKAPFSDSDNVDHPISL